MTFEWSAIWAAWPDLMAGSWMTIQITLLGLVGGTIIGALSGVVVTYVPVPVTRRTLGWGIVVLVAAVLLLRLASWLGDGPLAGVPGEVWWGLRLVVLVLLAWEYLPKIKVISSNIRFLDAFFISSPSAIWQSLMGLLTGQNDNRITLWPYLWLTLSSTLAGTLIGLLLGGLFGLVFSNNRRLSGSAPGSSDGRAAPG